MRNSVRQFCVGLAILAALVGAREASAGGEIVPALGISKPVEGDQTQMSGSLARRGDLLPILMAEVGVSYRSEDRFDDQLHMRQWPITGSLYVRPARPVFTHALEDPSPLVRREAERLLRN